MRSHKLYWVWQILLPAGLLVYAPALTAQQAWYWYEIVQNDSVPGGDLIVDLKVASDRIAEPQNRLRSAALDLIFDTTQIAFAEALDSDLILHNDTTDVYGIHHDLAPAPGDSLMRLTAFSMIDDEELEDLGFVIGLDPVCMAKYRFSIKPPGLTVEPPMLETVEISATVTFLDFLECTPDGLDGCTMFLESPSAGPAIHVSSKVLLQGAHSDSAAMASSGGFQAQIPLAQPFSDPAFDSTPLEYDSLVSLSSIPPDMIDWVLVSLRTDVEPETEIPGSKRAAILLNDGRIRGTNGQTLSFPGVAPGTYFMVVRHRNHLAIMTPTVVDVDDGLGLWDFTFAASQAYTTSGPALKDMGDGSFAMKTGDSSLDGQVTAADFNMWLLDTKAVVTGYVLTDFNLDGQVTAADFNVWLQSTKAAARTEVP